MIFSLVKKKRKKSRTIIGNRIMNTEEKTSIPSSFVDPTTTKKTKCILCRKSMWLPLTCSKCQGEFCIHHQLPESHKCPKIDLYKKDLVDLVAIKPSKLEYI